MDIQILIASPIIGLDNMAIKVLGGDAVLVGWRGGKDPVFLEALERLRFEAFLLFRVPKMILIG